MIFQFEPKCKVSLIKIKELEEFIKDVQLEEYEEYIERKINFEFTFKITDYPIKIRDLGIFVSYITFSYNGMIVNFIEDNDESIDILIKDIDRIIHYDIDEKLFNKYFKFKIFRFDDTSKMFFKDMDNRYKEFFIKNFRNALLEYNLK